MSRNFIIQTKYKADGKEVEKTHTRMSKSFGRFAAQMADGNSMIGKSFGRINQTINRGLMIALTTLIATVGLATREYIKFDQTIVGANTRFVDFVRGSEQSVLTLEKLKVAAREVGKTTQFSATAAASGLNFYAKAGFNSAEAMAVLADTVDLATVAEADFNRTADISSDLLGALGKNVDDSATKIQNLKDINRALGITANSANVDLEDLFETLKVAAPIATAAGEGMNELFAITGALGGAGIKGSMGATALKNAYIRLAAPTNKVTAALDKLGLSQKDFVTADGDMKSMVKIMQQLGDASQGLGKAEQLGVFAEIFGKNAVAGAVNLAASLSEVELIMKKLESQVALKDLADEIRKGLGMQIEILKSGLIELGFKFVEAFEKNGRGALQGIINFIQTVDITPLIKFSEILVKIFGFVAKNWKLLLAMAGGIKAVALAMGILNIATTIFGATLKASPVGLIITLVFLLGSAIAFMVLNWEKVVPVLKSAWEWIKMVGSVIGTTLISALKISWEWIKMVGSVIGTTLVSAFKIAAGWIAETGQKFTLMLGPIGFLISALIEIAKQWDTIKESFASGGILGGILAIGRAILSGLLAPMQGFLEMISNIPGIGNLAEGAFRKIAEIREGLEIDKPEGDPNDPDKPQPEFPSFPTFTPTNGNPFGRPETPTPTPQAGSTSNGRVDININNSAGDNAQIKQKGQLPAGTALNFKPAMSF